VSAGATLAISTASTTPGLTTQLAVTGGIDNAGTISVVSAGSQSQALLATTDDSALENHGTIALAGSTAASPYASQIQAPLHNEADGSVHVTGGTALLYPVDSAASTSSGTIRVDAGATFSVENGSGAGRSLTIDGGAIVNDGTFALAGSTFVAAGGTISGANPITTGGAATLRASGTGTGTFATRAGDQLNLDADVAHGYTVRVPSGGLLVPNAPVTNHGTIDLRGSATVQAHLVGAVTNAADGTVRLAGDPSGGVDLHSGLVNHGTLAVTGGSVYEDSAGIAQADGTLTIDAGATLNASPFVQSGGTTHVLGVLQGSGLTVSGGSADGNPPAYGGTLALGGGSGTYVVRNAQLTSDVPAGIHLIADGDLGVVPASVTNRGTVELRGGNGANPNLYGNAFANAGTLQTDASVADYRVVNSALSNSGTIVVGADLGVTGDWANAGTIRIADGATLGTGTLTQSAGLVSLQGTGARLDANLRLDGGTLAGDGTVHGDVGGAGTVGPAPTPATLTIDGGYAQAAGGFFAAGVAAAGHDELHVTGAATLAGTLQVTTDGTLAPPQGAAYEVVHADGGLTGAFATSAGLDSGPYALGQDEHGVTLTARGRPVAPPPPPPPPATPSLAIGDATVAKPSDGSATATFAVTLSAAALDPVSVRYATANGSAAAPDDYRATSGTLTFPPGSTTQAIAVPVAGNDRGGSGRTFFVDLSAPVGATLAAARGTGTILGHLSLAAVSPDGAGDSGSARISVTGKDLVSCLIGKGFLAQNEHTALDPLADLKTDAAILGLLSSLPSRTPTALGALVWEGNAALGAVASTQWAAELAHALRDHDPLGTGPFAAQNLYDRVDGPEATARFLRLAFQLCPPDKAWHQDPVAALPVKPASSNDPNELSGPAGPTSRHWLRGARTPYTYTATFENLPTAAAPAYAVTVTDRLDTARLDPATLTLGPITIGSRAIVPPPGVQRWSTRVDLRPARAALVDVSGALDPASGTVSWRFATIDPATGEPLVDPVGGFLPADKAAPEGQGTVSFTVLPRGTPKQGATIANAATIVFDRNAPIATPTWSNRIDRTAPTSRVTRLRAQVVRLHHRRVHRLVARWRGRDTGAGVAGYAVSLATGRAKRLTPLTPRTSARTYTLRCHPGTRYRIGLRATDAAGNVQKAVARSKPVRCR